jgi:dephospho-CoA kinase
MIRIGLTGTLGAGKSTVADLFERWGAARIDADRLAREAVAAGTPGLRRVVREFGPRVLRPSGDLAREALRRIVFRDPAAREKLEAIVHPEVDRLRRARTELLEKSGARIVVLDVPLLFEKGLDAECDVTVTVDAPVEQRRARVVEERGLGPGEFEAIDAAQWPAERKRAAADHVIRNDADRETLRGRARAVWDAIAPTEKADDSGPRVSEGARWRIDLHTHTSASHDCLSDPEDVVRRARAVGLDRIAVTDHDEIEGALRAREVDPVLVVVGEEVRTAEGLDLIGLFLETRIPPGGTFREVSAAIREQGGIVYLPHPFDARRGADPAFLEDRADCVDAVEGFNARIHDPARNERAVAWARARCLPLGAGSDAHTLREIGRGRAIVPPFEGPGGLATALHAGRIEGTASSRWVHVASTLAKLRRDREAPGEARNLH